MRTVNKMYKLSLAQIINCKWLLKVEAQNFVLT